MTNNQVAYWSNEEQKRSNRVQEFERNRSNLATEGELLRHNQAMEQNEYQKLQEAQRANRAKEESARRQQILDANIAAQLRASNERIAQYRNQSDLLRAKMQMLQSERTARINQAIAQASNATNRAITSQKVQSAQSIAAHDRAQRSADNFELRRLDSERVAADKQRIEEMSRANKARERSTMWQNVVNSVSAAGTIISAIGKFMPRKQATDSFGQFVVGMSRFKR